MQRLFSKEQVRELIKDKGLKTADDAMDVLKDLFKDVIQEMLEAELDTELGYEKNEKAGLSEENRRNGCTSKKVRSELGEIELTVPRDRTGEFEPIVVRKNQKNITGIEEQILALYAKGVSTREIQDHLISLYGIDVSPTLISNVTNKILPMIKEWR
jgi:putative transposase